MQSSGLSHTLTVEMQGEALTLQGKTTPTQTLLVGAYLNQERQFGRFSRPPLISVLVNSQRALAHVKHGVIPVALPLAEDKPSETIEIKVAN